MPADREGVVTVGGTVITILKDLVSYSSVFVTLIVKLFVPAAVGTPVMAPLVAFKFKPVGRLPLATDQVIGVVPVALSV